VQIHIFGYARVSKNDQSLDIQLEKLQKYGCDEIYKEKISGIENNRSELNKLLDRIRKGDKIIVQRLDC
jgi:DNA invertase Pin-like site-specific DNA recombinase